MVIVEYIGVGLRVSVAFVPLSPRLSPEVSSEDRYISNHSSAWRPITEVWALQTGQPDRINCSI